MLKLAGGGAARDCCCAAVGVHRHMTEQALLPTQALRVLQAWADVRRPVTASKPVSIASASRQASAASEGSLPGALACHRSNSMCDPQADWDGHSSTAHARTTRQHQGW
jgi:hypothetical protein